MLPWLRRCHILVALALPAVLGSARAQEVSTVPEHWNVRDFGALGDGETDDTAAFQAALDAAAAAGGGIVRAPTGNYMIATHIAIPDNVTLEGVFTVPSAWSQGKGTTLLAVEGEGSEEGPPFISLGVNSVLKGVTVYYPNQNDYTNVKPYPWCIGGRGGDNPSVIDCMLVNPYNGVDFGTNPSGRHYIRNLYGHPLRRGIFVDQCYDVGRIENVHFWPFSGAYHQEGGAAWIQENGEALIFGRTDWEYVLNVFVFGYSIGYRFVRTPHGACNGNFVGIGADSSEYCVWVDDCWPYGVLITNGEFVAMAGEDPIAVVVAPTCTGDLLFSNCAFWGPSRQLLRHEGSGTVTMQSCNFRDWDTLGEGRAAIEARSGQLIVQGCNFAKSAPHVALGPDLLAATIVGNRFAGAARVRNESQGSVQVGLNAETVVDRAEITLGAVNRGRFITLLDTADSVTRDDELEGRWCRLPLGLYMLFNVADVLSVGLDRPNVTIAVDYLDVGEGVFYIEYDSSDREVLIVPSLPGAFKATRQVALEGTGEWRTATFEIGDAVFANRCNGGDFRITAPSGPVPVSRVLVTVP